MRGAARAKARPAGLNTLDLRLLSTDLRRPSNEVWHDLIPLTVML